MLDLKPRETRLLAPAVHGGGRSGSWGFIAEGFVEGMHAPHRWNGLGIMFGTNAIVRIAARLGRTLAP